MASNTDKILPLGCWCWTDWENTLEHNEEWKELCSKNSVHEEEETCLCFVFVLFFFSIWSTAVANQRNLGEINGKNILVYSWRAVNRQPTTGFRTFACPMLRSRNCEERAPFIERIEGRTLMKGVVHCGYVMIAELIVCRTIVSQLWPAGERSHG